MKHLDLQFYQLRDTVWTLLITPVYIQTHKNVVNLFTKIFLSQFVVPKLCLMHSV